MQPETDPLKSSLQPKLGLVGTAVFAGRALLLGGLLLPAAPAVAVAAEPLPTYSDIRGSHSFEFVVDPERPPFRFDYVGDADNYPVEIRCYLPGAGSAFQRLEIGLLETPYRGAEYLEALDMNRDGYNDLRVLAFWGVTGNHTYDYFLWNPATSRFDQSEEYAVCNEPSDGRGCCRSHSVGGKAGHIFRDAVYCPEGGRLALVEEVAQDWDPADQCFHKTVRKFEGGELQSTSTSIHCDPFWQQ